ncbi:biotin operon repressor / biotin-protein ligase [hydrocarbon metagenome]|uniref:Biotin operon repressor / biotin-protein ligase n=1 Tax=hydrocarbon metagenome TaxID=938273 RepID=A0A0W8E2S1_9ZZZZ
MNQKQLKIYGTIPGRCNPIRNFRSLQTKASPPSMLKCINLQEGGKFHLQGKDVYLFRSVDSTNSTARAMAQSGVPDGTIIVSETQITGRGRRGRQWSCPPGKGILMSMIIRPPVEIRLIPLLTLLTGVVVAESIYKATGCVAGIKWPNDLIINGKKVCGILAESSIKAQGSLEYVIIGIGINVNLEKHDLPVDCMETSTSLKIELGQVVSRLNLIRRFILTWEEHYQGFLDSGYSYVRQKWIENNSTLGRMVTISKGSESIDGLALDISDRGGLIVELSNGVREEFLADDVTLGRYYYRSTK